MAGKSSGNLQSRWKAKGKQIPSSQGSKRTEQEQRELPHNTIRSREKSLTIRRTVCWERSPWSDHHPPSTCGDYSSRGDLGGDGAKPYQGSVASNHTPNRYFTKCYSRTDLHNFWKELQNTHRKTDNKIPQKTPGYFFLGCCGWDTLIEKPILLSNF